MHDGPGIRTVAFLKGCPLRCRWCQNPESLHKKTETAFYADRCAGCMTCQAACPNGAIRSGAERIDRTRCKGCGQCAEACPNEALRAIGYFAEPEGLVERIGADRPYFLATGGGVTLSGGEPLAQADGSARLLALARQAGMHTVVETCGAADFAAFFKVIPYTDLFYFDLKAGGNGLHKELTGVDPDRIHQNAKQLLATGADVVFRMPVIPGHNDSSESLQSIAGLLTEFRQPSIRLLRYHRGGEAKIDRIAGKLPKLGLDGGMADEALERARERFEAMGIEVEVEGDGAAPTGAETTETAQSTEVFPDRVFRLREAVQSAKPAVCPERALLVTEYFRDSTNRKKPMVIQKAEALRHVLRSRKAAVYEDELLVGCSSSKRVGGSIFPELHGVAVLEDLFAFPTRKVNPLQIERKEATALATRVVPFWLTRFLAVKAFPLRRALGFVVDQLTANRYIINETGGVSHFVPDYEKLLKLGTTGIAGQARTRRAETDDPDKRDFYRAVEIACAGLEEMADRYVDVARDQASLEADPDRRGELESIAKTCERVPRYPARTIHEAFQSILFAQIALNLESLDNAVSPGRLDQILYPYYRADAKAGRIDDRKAAELAGCYNVKMSEIVPVFSKRITRFHGGLFNGQVAVVGGTDRDGKDAVNELTWIFLEAMDKLRMRQPNYHARVHAKSPKKYLKRVASMLRDGSSAPSLMNDEVVVDMLTRRGTSLPDARDYSPVGCVEPVACGKTFGSTDAALTNLAVALEWTLGTKEGGAATPPLNTCRTMDELLGRYRIQVEHLVRILISDLRAIEQANADYHPTPLTSMLLDGCLESGVDSSAGGATYNGSGVQGVGVADVADSLAAIRQVVFERRLCDLPTLAAALKSDFRGHETLQGRLLKAPKFGNDDPAVDRYAKWAMHVYSEALGRYRNTRGGDYWAGFYSVTANKAFGETTGALPSGRPAGHPLANGLSPGNGLDRLGPTAVLNSAAGTDLTRYARNGINLNLKLDGSSLSGTSGVGAIEGLIRGYFAKGGMQVQLNVMDPGMLLEARDHPERYPWLLVRVSGYSAYFNDLSPGVKQEIIDRSLHCGW